jgi:tetratricopeptide (TPR) repeat protein
MNKIDKIINAIEKEKFDIAGSMLLELWQRNTHDSYINYLLGYFYSQYRNPARSNEKAKRHFRYSISYENPIERAFYFLANLEKNQEQKKRILLRGLTFFPNSKELHESLLSILPSSEKAELFAEMAKKGIDSENAIFIMIRHHYESGNYSLALNLIDRVQPQEKTNQMVCRLFKGICLLENREISRALTEFLQLVSQDITNILEYGPNILSIVAISRQESSNKDDVIRLFSQIPEDFQFIEPYYPGDLPINIDYMAYILEATKNILKLAREKDTIARIRAVRALCVIGSEAYQYYPKAKAYKDLIYAHSILPSVSKYTESLFELAQEKEDAFSAYIFITELFAPLYGKELKEKADSISWTFISECKKEIFQRIYEDYERKLESRELSTRSVVFIVGPIIKRLHKENNYAAVRKLANKLGDNIKDTEYLFEVAYALADGKEYKKAGKYYELLLNNNGDDTSVLNNLALIHEQNGNVREAERLLIKARKIDPDHALAKRNLERIISFRKTAIKFMAMPYKNKSALLRLWEARNIEDKIIIKNDELPVSWKLSDDETKDILNVFIKTKVLLPDSGGGKAVKRNIYSLNPAIRDNIIELKKEIEEKSPIIDIISDINNDGLSRIGFNKEIIDTLGKLYSVELGKLLKRDLQEAAFALLTRSYKATQVMCGSIIEAVLLDKLSSQGRSKYQCADNKTRSINRMSLTDLLFVSLQEKLIDEQLYHFAHALRGYRNLIHPGVEQRGRALPISEQDAKLAWDITRKLLKEI